MLFNSDYNITQGRHSIKSGTRLLNDNSATSSQVEVVPKFTEEEMRRTINKFMPMYLAEQEINGDSHPSIDSHLPRTKSQGVGVGERFLKKPDPAKRMHYGFKPSYVNKQRFGKNVVSSFNQSMSQS